MRNVVVGIGKPCKKCGTEIQARHQCRNWAVKNRDFCSKSCANSWTMKGKGPQATQAMRDASQTPRARAKRSIGIINSPKIEEQRAKTLIKKAQAEVIRLSVTRPCACGCGTEIPTIMTNGKERYWVKGHQNRRLGSKEKRKEKVTTSAVCVVCGKPILARIFDVAYVEKIRRCCSPKCNLILARRQAETPESRSYRIEKVKAFMATDPRFCAGLGHFGVRPWRLRSPSNVIYEFRNLRVFVKENEHLFAPEDVVWRDASNGPYCKALNGLQTLSIRRKNPGGQWKGWTWHSQTERLKNDSIDLLERPIVTPSAE